MLWEEKGLKNEKKFEPKPEVYILLYIGIQLKKKKKGKTQVQFLRLDTLGSSVEFKQMVALTNETQTMLSFPRIF